MTHSLLMVGVAPNLGGSQNSSKLTMSTRESLKTRRFINFNLKYSEKILLRCKISGIPSKAALLT
jgi:hypothetical protein